MKTKIVYEDKSILVVHKPAGLATQTARVGQQDVVSELKNYLAKEEKGRVPYLAVVHRLDQPVEGLLVFAKEKECAAELTARLADGTLNKQYYAVLCGKPSVDRGELVDYLIKESGGCARAVTGQQDKYPDAKRAVLQYQILQSGEVSLADIHIDTGRFHQIRVQMAHAGFPLLGDRKYGTKESMELAQKLGVRQVALCAYKLELTHPKTQKMLSFQIEPESKAFLL